eukprot:766420-Hanusia_phi.AAC.1
MKRCKGTKATDKMSLPSPCPPLLSCPFEVFSAGIDGRVVHYRRVIEAAEANETAPAVFSWVVAGASRFHTHDIRCLCLAGTFFAPSSKDINGKYVPTADPSHPHAREAAKLDYSRLHRCIVSGGVDTQMCLYTYEHFDHNKSVKGAGGKGKTANAIMASIRLPPWPAQPCVAVSGRVTVKEGENGRNGSSQEKHQEVRMLSWQSDGLDMWRWE